MLQTTHYLIHVSGISQWLTEIEIFAMLFAAAIHDFEERVAISLMKQVSFIRSKVLVFTGWNLSKNLKLAWALSTKRKAFHNFHKTRNLRYMRPIQQRSKV